LSSDTETSPPRLTPRLTVFVLLLLFLELLSMTLLLVLLPGEEA
jgi:hypothetical protein